ncbi:sialin isoform X1 [Procambarus clarkii]|uniref:sialin isoform X1 n=1 Tax=Procambarus clarkii TaxID=6728 RepID=UPI0037437412
MFLRRESSLSTITEVDSNISTPSQERRFSKHSDTVAPSALQPGDRPSHPGDRPSHPGDRHLHPGDRPSHPGDRPSHPGDPHLHPGDHQGIFAISNSAKLGHGNSSLKVGESDGHTAEETSEGWGVRHTLAVVSCLGVAIQYTMRMNLSIAIVPMVGKRVSNTTLDDTCPLPDNGGGNDTSGDTGLTEGDFDWNEQTQGLVLGSFFLGYATTQILGERAAEYFGSRIVFGLSVFLSSVLTLLNPVCAWASLELFIFIRIVQGAIQGVTFPALFHLLATWLPPKDKAKLVSIMYSGTQVGVIVGSVGSGWLCHSEFLGGWPSTFYVFGVVGLTWCVPWFLLVHDTPRHHPRISSAELTYIQSNEDSLVTRKIKIIPWKAIMTSRPMWAAIMCAVGANYYFYTFLTELPSYFSNIQHFKIAQSGLVASLSSLALIIVAVIWGTLMEALTKRRVLSVLSVRRLSMALGYSSSVLLLTACFVKCDPTMAAVVMILAMGISGTSYSGGRLIEQDIAPNLASTLVGFNNTIAAITGFLSPVIAGAITNNNQTVSGWNTVFIVAGALSIFTTTISMIFMSAEVQPWNTPPPEQGVSTLPEKREGTSTGKEALQ